MSAPQTVPPDGGGRPGGSSRGPAATLAPGPDRRTPGRSVIRPSRSIVAAVTAVLLVGGAGSAWAWTEHEDRVAAEQASAQDRASDVLAAQVRDADEVEAQAADAARVRSAAVLSDARAVLAAAAEHARATLAASDGAVADDAVRKALAAELAGADAALAATGPGAGQSATALRSLSAALAASDAAVVGAHDAWLAEEAAAAAAAAAAPRPSTPGKPATSAPSCGTTYSGPPFYTSPATAGGDGSNGRLPPEALAAISWDVDPHGTPYFLKNAAAAALERLNTAFRGEFGHNLDLDLTYRDYDTQVAMRAALGSVAATPGTSTHGTGLALDVPELPCEYGWDTPQRSWMVSNGPSYGWVSPSWAGRNGSNPEYWHFEYRG
ncbi:peptidase M15 [Cellulomonas humilata]|uniref:Peptidase M15 n=1 Tax=Cellulomonas humilata TaxID=144055 RepID=A0A7Y6DZ93_9CELL|nr:peptidase M15 [Cellulomonas humilata]